MGLLVFGGSIRIWVLAWFMRVEMKCNAGKRQRSHAPGRFDVEGWLLLCLVLSDRFSPPSALPRLQCFHLFHSIPTSPCRLQSKRSLGFLRLPPSPSHFHASSGMFRGWWICKMLLERSGLRIDERSRGDFRILPLQYGVPHRKNKNTESGRQEAQSGAE